MPEIMLCKPTTNDRWDRRAVELVAFQHTHGHCNVPEVHWALAGLAGWAVGSSCAGQLLVASVCVWVHSLLTHVLPG